MKKNITLRDVAKLADVSVGSVSRYINGNANILRKNRERIQRAIEELNYTPNALAQNFAKGTSKNVLVFMATEAPMSSATWLYGLPIIQGINEVFESTGYSVQVSINSFDNLRNLTSIQSMMINQSIDGILYVSSWSIDEAIWAMFEKQHFPYVLIGNDNPKNMQNDVLIDIYHATRQLVDYLYGLGHRKMGAILGYADQLHTRQRIAAFKDGLDKLQLPCDMNFVKTGSFDLESGYSLMENMLQQENSLPSAIICGNDDIACGVIRAAQKHGLSIPGDLSVTGFDDSIIGRLVEPTITTVHIPSLELGNKAAKMLLQRIDAKGAPAEREMVACKTIVRDSTSTF